MGVLDKVKGIFSSRKDKMHEGVDKAADFARDKVGDDKAEKVDKAQQKADEAVDKLAGDDDDSSGSTS